MAIRALRAPSAVGVALLAGGLLAMLPATGASARDADREILRFGGSAAVPCTLQARAASGADEVGSAFPLPDRCKAHLAPPGGPSVPFDAPATWDGAYRDIALAAGVRIRAYADSLPAPSAGDSLSLGGTVRFRGLTVGATYVGDRFADTLGYGIGAAYRFGPFRVGAGLAETRPEAQARSDDSAATGRTVALDLEYTFLPALRGFVEYLSVVMTPDERPDPPERDSTWAIGLTLGF